MAEHGEWISKGASLSGVTATKEYGVTWTSLFRAYVPANWNTARGLSAAIHRMIERRSAVTGGRVGLIFLLVWLDSKLRGLAAGAHRDRR